MVDALQDRLEVFRRHRRKAISFFLIVVLTSTVCLLLTPGTYESEAALFVQLGRESVTLDPIATTGPTMSVQNSREYEINAVTEVLRNDGLADAVAESIGYDRLLRNEDGLQQIYGNSGVLGDFKLRVARWLKSMNHSSDRSDQELARETITSGLRVRTVPMSSIVNVSCRADTPELARDLTSTLVDEYLRQHIEMHQTPGSEHFFATQTELIEQRLHEAEAELQKFKNEKGILTIVGNQAHLQKQLDLIEEQRLTVESELASARSHAAALVEFAGSVPDRLTTTQISGLPNVARDTMRQQLYLLEIELQDLESRLTETHPQVVSTKKKIDEARQVLENQPDERSQVESNLNLTHQNLMLDAMKQQALEAGYESKLASLKEQKNAILERIEAANVEQARTEELERKVLLLSKSYQTYAEKLEATRITSQLKADQISNVHVVQRPTISTRSIAPNKPILFVAALLLGVLGAYLIVMIAEALDQRVHHPEEVEEFSNIPVLASIPRVSRRYASLN